MRKVYNFSAGPAMLPEEVLLTAQREMLDWHDTGMSVMELGHRGPEYQVVMEQAEADLRTLMSIPDQYKVLFLAGGATAQFSMIPINLSKEDKVMDYIDTGIWSKKALNEAKRYGAVNVAAQTDVDQGLICIPPETQWLLSKHAAFVHYTPNETIEGIEFNWVPNTGAVPLVADMSSMILSRPIDVSRYGIIYAGAQKNIGQAGITIVIIREDLIKEPPPRTPILYSYKTCADNRSMYNTPPTYSWYIAGLVLAWMRQKGGVEVFYKMNQRKAAKLYDFIDSNTDFYYSRIHPSCRSMMNVVFNLRDEALQAAFMQEAAQGGLTNLKGHRLVGGLRASIYNAMPELGVDKLVEFMRDFAKRYG